MQQTRGFIKMHGLGNDFAIFDARHEKITLTVENIQIISNRHMGIGCDQVLVLEPPTHPADVWMRIFNPDGTEAENCGNGLRCIARLLFQETGKKQCKIQVGERVVDCKKAQGNQVCVDMGYPSHLQEVDLKIPGLPKALITSTGNPHAIFFLDDVEHFDVALWGPKIEHHEAFEPARTNVHFVKVLDNHTLRLKIWERGAGMTKACGSGAVAVGFAAYESGLSTQKVCVKMDGGEVIIETLPDEGVIQTGPAEFVFEGEISI